VSEIRMTFDYEEPRPHVWHALTDPACMTRWMVAARPEGFEPRAGCHFRFIGKPRPGWSGVIDCEVVVATAPSRLRFNWISDGDPTMDLTFDLEELGAGTRLHFAQTGFSGATSIEKAATAHSTRYRPASTQSRASTTRSRTPRDASTSGPVRRRVGRSVSCSTS